MTELALPDGSCALLLVVRSFRTVEVGMLPHYDLIPVAIPLYGDVTLVFGPFGCFLALACFATFIQVIRRAKVDNLSVDHILWITCVVAATGLVGSRVFAVVFYFPDKLLNLAGWQDLLNVHGDKSSFGGLLFGSLFLASLLRSIDPQQRRRILDVLMEAVIMGFLFGRLGCALMHDHPGTTTSFVLGFQYPDGVRHDLGFYEFLLLLAFLYPLTLVLRGHKAIPGTLTSLCAVSYGFVRFFLDFLRIDDTRYFGLTPAQYGSIALTVFGAYLWSSINSLPKEGEMKH